MNKDKNNISIELKNKFSKIKLLVLDFDGTLTDNKVYVNQDGSESVKCDRGDGFGLELLQKKTNVQIIILSKETNRVTKVRADKLNIPCDYGVDDKITNFVNLVNKLKLDFNEVCFVGNDLNDIDCIKKAGIGIAVNDAYEQVKKTADYITIKNGGNGAVREVCDLILYAKNIE
jgi:YrbI family 3-deoxy-D-manno-octulosonate 8-phosphate phosphatase